MRKYILLIIFLFTLSSCNLRKKILTGGNLKEKSFTTQIPFTFDYGIPFIKVTIGGKIYNFMFDTGAATVVSPEIVEALKLNSKISRKVGDSQGVSNAQNYVVIPTIKVGELSFNDIGAVVIASSPIFEYKCLKYDGIIGSNLMAKAIWQIDYQNQLITTTDKLSNLNIPDDAAVIDFIPKKGQETPLIPIKIGNISSNITFDTGFNGDFSLNSSVYDAEISNLKYLESNGRVSIGIYGNSKGKSEKFVKVPAVRIGQLTIKNQIINFSNLASNTIGNDFLKHYNVILNWNENKIYMIQQSIFNFSTFVTFGINLKYVNNKAVVAKVFANSEAEKSGILVNDELTSLNGIDLTNLNTEQACYYTFNNILKSKDNTIGIIINRKGEQMNYSLNKITLLE